MKKTLPIAAALLLLVTAASAVQITPGQQTNITSNTSDLQTQSSDLPLTFTTSNSTLFAEAPEGFPSQSGSITLNYTNSTQELSAEIVDYSDWDLQVENFADNVSVGDTGRFGTVNFTQNGNVQADVEVSASGNLTEYLSFDDQFTLFPQNTIKKTVSYNIPRSTEFGTYTAQFNFTENSSGINKTVNVSTVFEDNIAPVIDSTSFPHVMSTRSENFTAGVSENYNVSSVEAEIVREAEEQRENKTVLVNKTVGTESFERVGQEWRTEFSNTENIGTYYYTLTVTDEAGNTATDNGSFQVKGLDAVEFLNRNFRFDSVYPKDADTGIIDDTVSKAKMDILEISEETSVDVQLQNFQHDSENSTITVGILEPGQDVSTKFDLSEQSDSITLEDVGTYQLVVESDTVESYSGKLRVELVDQHVGEKVRTIQFEGLVNNPEYPPEQSWSIKGFNATLEYENHDNTSQPDVLKRTLTAPADVCKGFSDPKNCPEINDFTEIVDKVKTENDTLRSHNAIFLVLAVTGVLFGIVFSALVIRRYAARSIVAAKPVKREDYDELFTEEQLEEYGVLN